jgi:photosystem II P680 reaction center D1 protein
LCDWETLIIKKTKDFNITPILQIRQSESLRVRYINSKNIKEKRLYICCFGVLMIPTLLTSTSVFIIAFIAAPTVDIDGIREPVSGYLLYGNNIICGAIIPTSAAIGLHFYPIWEAASVDEWLYNGDFHALHLRLQKHSSYLLLIVFTHL